MFSKLKYFLIGTPLPTYQLSEKRLNKIRALAAFSPDALSSIAYANQEIYLGLVIAGAAGLSWAFPIALAITILLIILAISYFQTIKGYPSGGGSYVVARENLGTIPGLVAAAALLIDYLLNAAVSLTAGVAAIASAFPELWAYRVPIALGILLVITLANLRGLRETGTLMAIPVYLFLFTYIPMLAFGALRAIQEGPGSLATTAPAPLTLFTITILLHTFSTGCTALTGIESISNGVPAFKSPEAKNAGKTLIIMAVLMGLLFFGSIGLTQYFAVVAGPDETILSALARRVVGDGPIYLLIQTCTLLILSVAANTSFAGFPRIASILAKDSFLPRQLTSLGDRLVYNNGIILLSVGTAILILVFSGDSHLLIPLFAIGAFLAFTLSQAGMVIHWWRIRGRSWQAKLAANALGALATGLTLLVVGYSKFLDGAWLTVILIPSLVMIFLRIGRHYQSVSAQLSLRGLPPSLKPTPPPRVVVPISGVHRGMIDAINFARSISSDVMGVYIEMEPGSGKRIETQWHDWWPDLQLVVVPSPYRSIIGPLLDFLDKEDSEHNDGQCAVVVLPQFIPARWWQELLHNQTHLLLKAALLYRRRRYGYQRVIIDVPFHFRK